MADGYPFVDPITNRTVVLRTDGQAGVDHPGCLVRADVSPELDAFYCRDCHWNGRISGAWFMDVLSERADSDVNVTPPSRRLGAAPLSQVHESNALTDNSIQPNPTATHPTKEHTT